MHQYTGIVYKIISPREFVMDCSCWLCNEYGIVHFKEPHGYDLKVGDWVMVEAKENYNHQKIGKGYTYYTWEIDAKTIERTSKDDEIQRLEQLGETHCGWYESLVGKLTPHK